MIAEARGAGCGSEGLGQLLAGGALTTAGRCVDRSPRGLCAVGADRKNMAVAVASRRLRLLCVAGKRGRRGQAGSDRRAGKWRAGLAAVTVNTGLVARFSANPTPESSEQAARRSRQHNPTNTKPQPNSVPACFPSCTCNNPPLTTIETTSEQASERAFLRNTRYRQIEPWRFFNRMAPIAT